MRKSTILCVALLSLLPAGPFSAAEEQQRVSRLPPLPQPLDPALQEMFDKRHAMGGAVINLTLTQGHAPKFAKASETTAFTIRFDAVTPRSLRELAIFRTAEIVGSDYELNQHTPMMKMCGYSREQIAQVATWQSLQAVRRQTARAAQLCRADGAWGQRRRRHVRRSCKVLHASGDRRDHLHGG